MNHFSKKYIVILVIAVLLIVNIASISTIVYHSYSDKIIKKSEPGQTSMGVLRKEMNLNQLQMGKFAEFGQDFRLSTKDILEELSKLRVELINEMSSSNPDTTKMYLIAENIGIMHAQIKHKTIDHFLNLRESCTPEQFDRFINLFQRMLMDDNNMRNMSDRPRWGRRQMNNRVKEKRKKN